MQAEAHLKECHVDSSFNLAMNQWDALDISWCLKMGFIPSKLMKFHGEDDENPMDRVQQSNYFQTNLQLDQLQSNFLFFSQKKNKSQPVRAS